MLSLEVIRELLSEIRGVLPNESYLIGGLVRDYLIGKRKASDIDLTIQANDTEIEKVANNICRLLNGQCKVVKLGEDLNAYVVFTPQVKIDITPFERIEEDLSRRDFTINAIAWHIDDFLKGKEKFTDPFGGIEDLTSRILRAVKIPNLLVDAVRLLRQYRFTVKLSLKRDKNLVYFTRNYGFLIKKEKKERVLKGVLKILSLSQSYKALELIRSDEFDKEVFGFQISPDAIRLLKKLEENGIELKGEKQIFHDEFGRKTFLKLAIVLSQASKRDVEEFLDFYPLSEKAKKYLKFVIEGLEEIEGLDIEDAKEVYFYLKRFGNYLEDIGIISTLKMEREEEKIKILKMYKEKLAHPPLVNGREIVENLGLPPSRIVGELIDQVQIAYLKGEIQTKEDALEFLKKQKISSGIKVKKR